MSEPKPEISCYAYISNVGIDVDSISETVDGSISKMLEGCLGWRYQFAVDQDRMLRKLLKHGRFIKVRIEVVDADRSEFSDDSKV